MPQVTVYIRKEDLDKWKAIEKKTEWVHEHLNPTPSASPRASNTPQPIRFSTSQVIKDTRKEKPITYKKTNNFGA